MPNMGMTPAMLKAAVKARLDAGSVTAGARALGISRQALQDRLRAAEKEGMIGPGPQSNPSRWRPGADIVAARKAEFERVKASGPKASGNVIHLPDDGPFMVIPLGDLHLDSPGTDLELFEKWIALGNRQKRRTFILLGDVLDNWIKPLAHLYSTAETTAPEGWILLQHYLEQFGPDLDFSVGGNHDAWSGHSDVLGMLMDQYGVLHRGDSIRVTYRARGGRELTINARHSWPGRSMWNEVHGLKRAARMGVRDTILLGGHTHVSGEALEKDPMSGRLTFCYQVASFKTQDDYADQLGFLDRHVSPAVALVIDPRRSDSDPELVKCFHDPAPASDYLAFLRRKAA
jgi:DNA-binding Lrp family transcriptional regulator